MSRVIAKFQELSPIRQAAVIAGAAWNIALIVLAQRDLNRRDPSELRGSKALWRVLCLTNTVGPVLYFRWGRRKST